MIEEIFTPCVQTCLNHVEDMFTLRLHHIYRHVYIMLEDMFTWYLRTCLNNIRRHIYSMLEDMFTPSLNICLHHVGKPVFTLYNMFTQYSKTYLHRFERNSYSMLEDLILSCLKMHLHNVWGQFSIIFENMLKQYLETFFCIMFERMLCYVWRPVDTTFQACLKTY